MIDELETLRTTRAAVDPPTPAARHAARARWDHEIGAVPLAAPSRSGARTFTARMAIATVLATALVAGVWIVTRKRIESVTPKHEVAIGSLTVVPATDPQVFLLVGNDKRASQADQRTDTMALVRIDPATDRVITVSIPRDLFVAVPGCGLEKLNATFDPEVACGDRRGGTELLVDTITTQLHVPVNHVIQVDFAQFAALVNEIGGLRINFPVPARDTRSGLNEDPGCHTLTGTEALAFVRARFLEWFTPSSGWIADPRSDLGRMERQQLALRQLAVAAESRMGTDPRPMLRALFAHITVDAGFTADDALRYFAALRGDEVDTLRLPISTTVHDDQMGLVLTDDALSMLDVIAGRSREATVSPATGGPGPAFPIATAC